MGLVWGVCPEGLRAVLSPILSSFCSILFLIYNFSTVNYTQLDDYYVEEIPLTHQTRLSGLFLVWSLEWVWFHFGSFQKEAKESSV